jgi:hypothetical protein
MQVAIEKRIKGMFGVDIDHTKSGNASSANQDSQEQPIEDIARRVFMLMDEK